MNPLLSSALLEDLTAAQKVIVVPGTLPLPQNNLPTTSRVRAMTDSHTSYAPRPDRASATVLPMPGAYLTVKTAADACDRSARCAGVVSQRNGRTIGLLPLSGAGSGGVSGQDGLVAVPGTTTWLKQAPGA